MVPPVPPPAPIVQNRLDNVKIEKEADRADLNKFVSNKLAAEIMKILRQPLSGDAIPELQDLTPFFNRVERAVAGINANSSVHTLG